MVAGCLRSEAGDRVRVYTGGSEPVATLNPIAVEAMAELSIDISKEVPKPWTEEVVRVVPPRWREPVGQRVSVVSVPAWTSAQPKRRQACFLMEE
jgi:hypothetical protein